MEAVFTKKVKGMFSPPTTPKTFYCPTHPTTPRRNKKKAAVEMTIKDATGSLEGAHPQDPAHTLMPYSSPMPDHLSPKSGPAWDLNQHSGCHGNSSGTDINVQDSNSRFNESWPSRSDEGDGEVIGQSAEGSVGVEWKQEVGVANQNSQESILSRYVERFRRAPPTSRASRDMPTNPFWWKLDDDSAGDTPKDTTTPDTTPLDKNHTHTDPSHTHTDPSPEVSGELSLDLRSQDLIEKGSSLFTSFSDSPPAQKYHNSLGKREGVPSPSSSSDNGNSLKPTRKTWSGVDQQEEFKSALPSLRVTRLNPEQDILVQWRLQRKLEQARNESAAVNLRNRFYDPGGDKRQLRHRDFSHLLSAESSISQDQPCVATPPNSKCCSVEDSGALAVRPSHAALHCGCDCHTRGAGAVHLQGQEVPPQSLQEVQTGPPPQSSEMKKQEVQTRTGPLEQEVQTSSPHPPRPSQQEVEVCPPRQSGQQTRHIIILPNGNAILESGPDKDEFKAGGSMATIDSAHESSAQTTSIPLLPTGNGGVATTGLAQERKASIPLLPTLQREGTSVESHTQECDSASVCSSDEKEALSGTLEACTAPPEHSSSVDREHSISTESSLAIGGSPPTLTCKVPPTHGGLALRDMSLSEEEEGFSMTFNTAERSMQCNTPEGRAMSTPMHNKAAANEGGAASPVLPLMSPCGDPSDPLQKADSLDPSANGFPWEYDMDDPLLKLLITKARLFETQIREIDSRLMGMQKETQ